MTDATSEDPHVGEWVSTREAAARLKITERSVFRRISRGQLNKKLIDEKVMVFLTTEAAAEPDVMSEGEPQVEPEADLSLPVALRVMHVHMSGEIFREELRDRDRLLAAQSEELGRLRAELRWRRLHWWQRLFGIMTAVDAGSTGKGNTGTGLDPGNTGKNPSGEGGLAAAGAVPSLPAKEESSAGLLRLLYQRWIRLALTVFGVLAVLGVGGFEVVDASDGSWDGVIHACESILVHVPHP